MKYDLISSYLLILILALIGLGYSLRAWVKGTARYERVERQGRGVFLGTSLMQAGYWGMLPLGRFFVVCRVTPNQLSMASLGLAAIMSFCLGLGKFGLASLFMVFAALLDGLDGMVARMTNNVSKVGGLLDSVIDRYVEFFIFSGLLFYYQTRPWIQIVSAVALLGSFMVSYSTAKAEILGVNLPSGGLRRPERLLYLFIGTVLSPITIPFERIEGDQTPLAYPVLFALILVAVLSNVSAVQRFRLMGRSVRERSGRP